MATHYTAQVQLNDLTPPQFLALCVNTARSLDWNIKHISDAGLIAFSTKSVLKVKQVVTIRITGDLAELRSQSLAGVLFDQGRNRKNIEKFSDLLIEGRVTWSPEQLTQTYDELKPGLVPPDQDELTRPVAATTASKGGFAALFVPRKGYMVTPILVDLNLAIFLVMAVSGVSLFAPTIQSLLDWGANIRSLTLDGQWWRLITNTFIHIGILHVLLNMYALIYIGVLLEPRLGGIRFVAAYLLTGIVASVASLYWHPAVVSAGASGAIFGMYGVFLALLTTNFIDKTVRATLMTSIGVFVGYNLLNGTKGGIDNAAHIGGLVSGIVIGYLFYPGLKNPGRPALRFSGFAVAGLLVLAVTVTAFKTIPNNIGAYLDKMRSFDQLETQALALLRHKVPYSRSAEAIAVRKKGIPMWNQNIQILNEAKQLDVSEPLKAQADALIRYCNLRILSYNCIYRKLTDTTGTAADSLLYYNSQIKDFIDSVKGARKDN